MRPPVAIIPLLLAFSAFPVSAQNIQHISGEVVPGAEWQQTLPESVGYSSAMLEAVRGWLKTQDTDIMMVIVQGRVIFSYGDVSHTSTIASVRKSVLDMLYGADVFKNDSNNADLDKTVKQLGLDDKLPFLPIEEKATLIQLMASRSGIYMPTGNADQAKTMGVAFEKLTGKDIYQALQTDLATPLGMQDYVLSRQKKVYSSESLHPGYPMSLSTRDMARLGLLMLDCGQWNGKTIIFCDWARYSTYLHTPFRDINPTGFRNYGEPGRWGYGFLWWVWDEQMFPGDTYIGFLQGAYTAAGTGGTYITVIPAKDMVVVHQVDIDKDYRAYVSPSSYIAILSMIANANCGDNCKATSGPKAHGPGVHE
jgi:hypothetical protein